MRPSTEMLIVGGGFAAAAVGANALGLGVGSSPADWINAAAYGFGLGVVVFLVRFVDGETAAQQRSRPALIEERLARLEKAAGIEPDAERK